MKYSCSTDYMRIVGRTTQQDDCLYLGYSGSYVEFLTNADTITLDLRTDDQEHLEVSELQGVIAVWINGQRRRFDEVIDKQNYHVRLLQEDEDLTEAYFAARIKIDQSSLIKKIEIGTPGVEKSVKIMKTSEAAFGLTGIQSIEIANDYYIKPSPAPCRKIEFIGDSIACGYGNEGILGQDTFSTFTQNPADAYAILTAEAVQADYQLISWSGIGIISDYVDPSINDPREEILMPWLYPYNDVRFEERQNHTYAAGPIVLVDDKTPYDFQQYKPDLIVINLGTNDDSYVRQISVREDHFFIEYTRFLDAVHRFNPDAAILCCLGIMGQNLCSVEQKAMQAYSLRHPEIRMKYVILDEHNDESFMGIDYHPAKLTHKIAAEKLTTEIKEFMGW